MFLREHHSSNLSFGWSGGGGATIVLEDLGADAPATVTRAEFGMCAGHGVRSPTSSKFKRRVQVTVWAGAFVRFAAFEVAGRLLGVLGTRALSRLRTSALLNSNGLVGGARKLMKFLAQVGQEASATRRWVKKQTND